jgi:hypothetical protein
MEMGLFTIFDVEKCRVETQLGLNMDYLNKKTPKERCVI